MTVNKSQTGLELELRFASILLLVFLRVPMWVAGWVGVDIDVNANSAPN